MIKLGSSDNERITELKDTPITIIPCNTSKKIVTQHGSAKNVMNQIRKQVLQSGEHIKYYSFPDIHEYVQVSENIFSESFRFAYHFHYKFQSIGDAFMILSPLLKNAILLEVEEYRHNRKRNSYQIEETLQYLSVFHDFQSIIPVKITVHKKYNGYFIHMILPIDSIDMQNVQLCSSFQEKVANTYQLDFQEFCSLLTYRHSILFKHIPIAMLPDHLISESNRIRKHDCQTERNKTMLQYQNAIQNSIQNRNYVASRKIPMEYAQEFIDILWNSGKCFSYEPHNKFEMNFFMKGKHDDFLIQTANRFLRNKNKEKEKQNQLLMEEIFYEK